MKMKIRYVLSVVTILALAMGLVSLRAQETSNDPSGPVLLSPDDLDQLVAPIALYPDPLIALILPASTVPTDIVLANRYVTNGGDPNQIDAQNWDDNVKGLARYPDVLKMMDENLDWTNQLGAAVLAQQADVMTAIQAQRAKAQSLGNLATTPQQQVVEDQGAIQIVPADPQVIYVPVYDPQVVYVQPAPAVPFITFGIGLAIGVWLSGDCDWHNHGIYRGGYYRPGYGWGGNNVNININNNVNVWRPNPNKPRPRPPYQPGRPGNGNGHLPGWRPPPGGNNPNRPGGPGNRPGIPGTPGNPGKPERPENRPGNGGNRPGGPNKPGADKPQIKPAPTNPKPGETRPGKPHTKPGAERPATRPQPEAKPKPQPAKPSTRPTTPQPGGSFDRERPNTKQPTHRPAAQPKAQPRPQAQPRQQSRPQAQPKAQPQRAAGGGGGGAQRQNR